MTSIKTCDCGIRYVGETDWCGTCTPKRSKMGNVRTEVDGIRFDSKKEAQRFGELQLLQRAGKVGWFIRQPLFDLGGGTKYRADFLIVWTDGHVSIEDVKGHKTKAYLRSKKQVEALYPVVIEEV